ncbi:MAG TPA: TatD family hydrolase [Candidatus Binatia bacterium]|nr:TatD family hydrolase [Candidatus Binatia bacterium]
MTALVDAHCHLQLLVEREGGGAVEAALEASAAAGVEQVVCAGINLEDSDRCRVIAESNPGVFFTAGWHPHEPTVPDPAQLRALEELLSHPRAVGVGEIGLDQYWRPGYHETPLSVQQRSFALMLELARAHGLPAVVHDRLSHQEVLAAIDACPGVRGVMHCMSGDDRHARRCRERGFVISFAGNVTYRRNDGIRQAAREVDPEGYAVETDAPFLAPVPHRGRPSIPAHVADTAREVASLRGVSASLVAEQTTRNARRLFALPAQDRLHA